MKKHVVSMALAALMSGAVLLAIQTSFGQQQATPDAGGGTGTGAAPGAGAAGGGTGTGAAPGTVAPGAGRRGGRGARGPIADPNAALANLAPVADITTSFVSGDTSVDNLNDGSNGGSGPGSAYGNYNRRGTNWVEYRWSKPITTNKSDVLWWSDNGGIMYPAASRVKYWNGTEYVAVPNAQGNGVEGNTYNTTSFDEVTTDRIRLEMDSGAGATGIYEWRVYDSGKSPALAAKVTAGGDRLVVMGGKTFLTPLLREVKKQGEAGATLTWSKLSGPGKVTFADAASAKTTATIDTVGDYVLQLKAQRGTLVSTSDVKVKAVPPMPEQALNFVQTNDYTIDSPLWLPRIKSHLVSWIPYCAKQIETPNLAQGGGGLDNFINAAAKLKGEGNARHIGLVFSNAYVYNVLESMCVAQTVKTNDPEIVASQKNMRERIDKWIPIILAAQEPDGYIQTAFTLSNGQHWTPQRRGDHEGYTMGYFLETAVAHFAMTKGQDRRMYDAAKKCADCWVNNIGPEPGKKVWYDGHQEFEKALVRFGRLVNEVEGNKAGEKYIKLAKFLLDSRAGGQTYDQSHLPIVQQYEAVGHAVRAAYTYAGMAAVVAETHDIDYQSATLSIWDNILNKKYYITGGIGSGESSEGFGPNYSLRQGAYCESCSGSGQLFFVYNLNLAYHDAKFVDQYEETLYNAILGDTNLEGTVFNYTNPLDSSGGRTAWHVCPCCVGNIPRTLLQLPSWTYATGPNDLYVNLFVGSTMNVDGVAGTNVEMVQKTNYPWDGKVAMTVNPKEAKNFTLRVRVPNRTTSDLYKPTPEVKGILGLAVNGQAIANPVIEKGYALIKRDWKAGDRVEFTLPMEVQQVKSIDEVAANRGRIALKYGPLVYNIEVADNRANFNQTPIDLKAPLTTEWRPDFLQGVMVIKGKFADGSDLLAIPNYSRNNRQGRSIVWMLDAPPAPGTVAPGGGRRGGQPE